MPIVSDPSSIDRSELLCLPYKIFVSTVQISYIGYKISNIGYKISNIGYKIQKKNILHSK